MITVLLVILLLAALALGWGLTVLGMPGNWLIVLAAAGYVLLLPEGSAAALGWRSVVILSLLAALGELLELLAGALGVARRGGSRRAAVFGLTGSIAGGLLGMLVGTPIPVIGSLVASVLFAALGAFGGAVLGELSQGRGAAGSLQIGRAAFWGRLLGTLAKVLVGSAMVALAVAALIF